MNLPLSLLSLLLPAAVSFAPSQRHWYHHPLRKNLQTVAEVVQVPSPPDSQGRAYNRKSVKLDLLWFGGDSNKNKQTEKYQGSQKEPKSKMGTTATTMENFKQSQELGKKTGALLTDLSAATVEGTAAKGRIKVILDGEQRPKMVEIDEEYFEGVAIEDFTEALTSAMQDAYVKSTNLMEEKMSGLYTELGLPPTKQ